ncbi:MAG: glycosyltransferase family 4 protein [Desulfobacter sp.]
MKVLVYTSLFPNNLQPWFGVFIKQRMAHFAGRRNCEIRVVAPVPYAPPVKALGERWYTFSKIAPYEVIDGIEVYHPRYFLVPKISMPFHGLFQFLWTLGRLKKIRESFDFDLIDAHYIYPDGFAAVLAAKVLGVPVVLSARGSDIHEFPRYKTIRPLVRFALRHADHLISVSDALRQEMESLENISGKTHVIPNGVDPALFFPMDRAAARKKLGLSTESRIILSVGNLIPLKGFHLVIKSLPRLMASDQRLEYIVIGRGDFRNALEAQVRDMGLERRVKFTGVIPHSDLNTWYNAADVFCLASEREGWANVIMESLACGTPVVATNVYGAPEAITSDDLGILVERTPEAMGNGLQTALERNWDRETIVSHAGQFSWDRAASELEAIFSKLI